MPLTFAALHAPPRAWARVGVSAGLVAGAIYLAAQVLAAAFVLGGTGAEPLQQIGAILLGPDAAAPPREWGSRAIGMALLVHFTLAIAYGRVIDALVMHLSGRLAVGVAGAALGLMLYIVNFWIIAPSAFPWFEASRNALTTANHILFGVVAALTCSALRERLERRLS